MCLGGLWRVTALLHVLGDVFAQLELFPTVAEMVKLRKRKIRAQNLEVAVPFSSFCNCRRPPLAEMIDNNKSILKRVFLSYRTATLLCFNQQRRLQRSVRACMDIKDGRTCHCAKEDKKLKLNVGTKFPQIFTGAR